MANKVFNSELYIAYCVAMDGTKLTCQEERVVGNLVISRKDQEYETEWEFNEESMANKYVKKKRIEGHMEIRHERGHGKHADDIDSIPHPPNAINNFSYCEHFSAVSAFSSILFRSSLASKENPIYIKGYFNAFFNCFESFLSYLDIKKLLIPASEDAKIMWTTKYGFPDVTREQVEFQGTSLLEKEVPKIQSLHVMSNGEFCCFECLEIRLMKSDLLQVIVKHCLGLRKQTYVVVG
ncbi:hypothetical protein Tco_0687887 [Tanacetum coccineum]